MFELFRLLKQNASHWKICKHQKDMLRVPENKKFKIKEGLQTQFSESVLREYLCFLG